MSNCTDYWATPEEFANFWCLGVLSEDERYSIEMVLKLAAKPIHKAIAAANACSCSLADWAEEYLKELQLVSAMVTQNCPCANARVSDELKRMWLEHLTEELRAIRLQEIELCAGETAAGFAAVAYAESNATVFSGSRILANRLMREG